MEAVDTGSLAVQTIWAPVDDVDIYRVGMLVGWEEGAYDGVVNAGTAGGNPDATTHICGIISATDELDPTHTSNTTAVGNSVTGVLTVAAQAARNTGYSSDKGPWVKGDKSAHVKIDLLTPWTKVKVPLFNGNYGTAPTELTVTTASTSGLITNEMVTGACDFTPVANEATIYCRQGVNRGIMRVTDDTSTTQPTADQAMTVAAIPVGDTFVRVPYRHFGTTAVVTDAEALYFDVASTGASNNWLFNVLELNLQTAGQEHVIGYFASRHFDILT